jgi:hypothetical protein
MGARRRRGTTSPASRTEQFRAVPIIRRPRDSQAEAPAVTERRPEPVGRPTIVRPEDSRPGPVASAVRDGIDGLSALERHAQEVADGFRWNQIRDASRGLVQLVQGTQTMLRLADATARASGTRLTEVLSADELRADSETHVVVQRLLECQETGDWPALADTLDQDFVSTLGLWRVVFETLGRSGPASETGGSAA